MHRLMHGGRLVFSLLASAGWYMEGAGFLGRCISCHEHFIIQMEKRKSFSRPLTEPGITFDGTSSGGYIDLHRSILALVYTRT